MHCKPERLWTFRRYTNYAGRRQKAIYYRCMPATWKATISPCSLDGATQPTKTVSSNWTIGERRMGCDGSATFDQRRDITDGNICTVLETAACDRSLWLLRDIPEPTQRLWDDSYTSYTTHAVSRQRLRSASRHQLIVPHRRTIFGRRAFIVAGPTAWNSLPDYLRDPSLSEDTFRRLLKTYLFALY